MAAREPNRIPILMYHSIANRASRRFAPFVVSPRRFAEQMAYLAEAGYTPLTVTHLVSARARRATLPTRPVVLTFDDGFADFYTDALPILQRYGFTATLYVTTGYVGDASRWLARDGEGGRPMLTWEQLAAVSVAGVECGGHSHSHPALDAIPLVQARAEIAHSRELLQQHLGQPVHSFAYPFGYHNAAVRSAVWEAGYNSACAVSYAASLATDNPFALARLIIPRDVDRAGFARILTGKLGPASQMARRVRAYAWQWVRQTRTRHAAAARP